MEPISQYRYVQSIAKATMSELKDFITEGVSEKEIAVKAENIMWEKGILSFWYYEVGAFVHVGKRTTISESGRIGMENMASKEKIFIFSKMGNCLFYRRG
ncbi:hypothetical protein [Paenibacillus eucommiae]|uniref:Uncharacterized protein n=1 Tax=Paenibacillus eucommiae TaxID=1355755 RepID=A0ABS4J867_9BACL|nr:hypothetical protein [Paenibacillus eucommiae]MBP1995440.1 hypothetical protein [Paenibacillus eucommiae]